MGAAVFSTDTHVTTAKPNGLGATKGILFASTGGSSQPSQRATTPVMPIQPKATYYLTADYFVLAGFNGQVFISVVWIAQDQFTILSVTNVFGQDYRSAPAGAAGLKSVQQVLQAPVNAVYAVTAYNCGWPSGASAGSAYAANATAPNSPSAGAGITFNQAQDPTTYQNGVAGSYFVPNGATWSVPGGAAYTRINGSWVATSNSVTATPGTVILSTSNPGAQAIQMPPGNYAHVDIYLCGYGGPGNGYATSGGSKGSISSVDFGGSGASSCVANGVAVTPNTTTFNYNLTGPTVTLTGGGLNMSAPSGIGATTSAEGPAPAAATGGTTANYTGHAGGLTNGWDGGGCANASGVYVDNTTDGAAGTGNGVGGAGTWVSPSVGGPPFLQIIARA